MRKLLLIAVAATTFGLALPADAAPVTWKDPVGDASDPVPGVLPNEPALDITQVGLSFDGKDLKYTAKIDKLGTGNPPASDGSYFRFYFSHEDTQFQYVVYEEVGRDGGGYFPDPADPTADLTCSGCKGLIDRKTNTVTATLPIKSLSQGMRQHQSDLKPLGPGTILTALEATASRSLVAVSLVTDYAPPPANTTFTL